MMTVDLFYDNKSSSTVVTVALLLDNDGSSTAVAIDLHLDDEGSSSTTMAIIALLGSSLIPVVIAALLNEGSSSIIVTVALLDDNRLMTLCCSPSSLCMGHTMRLRTPSSLSPHLGHTTRRIWIVQHSFFSVPALEMSFAIWDLRCKPGSVNNNEVACIMSTCVVKEVQSSFQRRARREKADSKSVASVLYLKDEISIASAGALDRLKSE